MKIAYIAHPISGDVENNLKKVLAIVKDINLNDPYTVPFVPYYVDLLTLDDSDIQQRNRGQANNYTHFTRGKIDELWLYGDRISKGMWEEVGFAFEAGIKIVPKTKETKTALFEKCKKDFDFFADYCLLNGFSRPVFKEPGKYLFRL